MQVVEKGPRLTHTCLSPEFRSNTQHYSVCFREHKGGVHGNYQTCLWYRKIKIKGTEELADEVKKKKKDTKNNTKNTGRLQMINEALEYLAITVQDSGFLTWSSTHSVSFSSSLCLSIKGKTDLPKAKCKHC